MNPSRAALNFGVQKLDDPTGMYVRMFHSYSNVLFTTIDKLFVIFVDSDKINSVTIEK